MPAFVSPANLRLNTTKPDNALRVRKRARPSSQALPTTATSVGRLSRRSLSRLLLSAAFVLAPAKQSPAASRQQNDKDDLRARLSKRIPPRPRNGVRQRDLVFPEHCLGTWRVASTLTSVSAPAGYRLFGRTGALEDALEVRSVI